MRSAAQQLAEKYRAMAEQHRQQALQLAAAARSGAPLPPQTLLRRHPTLVCEIAPKLATLIGDVPASIINGTSAEAHLAGWSDGRRCREADDPQQAADSLENPTQRQVGQPPIDSVRFPPNADIRDDRAKPLTIGTR